jgi:hypothetical protein
VDRSSDPEGRIVRRPEPATGGSAIILAPSAIDSGTIARFGEIDRAARAYEAAIAALVAEADAMVDAFDEPVVVVTAEHPVPTEAVAAAEGARTEEGDRAATATATATAPADVATPVPAAEVNYSLYVTNCVACGEVDAAAVVAPLPQREPVVVPLDAVTPAQPVAAQKQPHSVAVIVARGADF